MRDPHLVDFDSEFFGKRIARADHPDVDDWARDHRIDCVQVLLDAADTETIQEAEARGYRLTDVRVTLERQTCPAKTVGIRQAEADDLARLKGIARSAHRITRYYADPRFDNARCDALYEGWIRNSVNGYADAVLVKGPRPMPGGYVTVHLNGRTASIGLIAVAQQWRRAGLGGALTLAAVDWAHTNDGTRTTVVTQGRNVAALRMFERAAFRVTQTQVWMHRWFDA